MGWIERARANVDAVDRSLPANASLKERRLAMRKAGPLFHGGTYWGRKMWGRAVREYLERHGQPPREQPVDPRLLEAEKKGDIIFPFRGE